MSVALTFSGHFVRVQWRIQGVGAALGAAPY